MASVFLIARKHKRKAEEPNLWWDNLVLLYTGGLLGLHNWGVTFNRWGYHSRGIRNKHISFFSIGQALSSFSFQAGIRRSRAGCFGLKEQNKYSVPCSFGVYKHRILYLTMYSIVWCVWANKVFFLDIVFFISARCFLSLIPLVFVLVCCHNKIWFCYRLILKFELGAFFSCSYWFNIKIQPRCDTGICKNN